MWTATRKNSEANLSMRLVRRLHRLQSVERVRELEAELRIAKM